MRPSNNQMQPPLRIDSDEEVCFSNPDFDHIYEDDDEWDDVQEIKSKKQPIKKQNSCGERPQIKLLQRRSSDSEDEKHPAKQKIINKKYPVRQRKDQVISLPNPKQQSQKEEFSIAKDLGLIYTKNIEHDLYYTMLSNTQSNIMYFIRIPLNFKIGGREYQLIKIGYTDDLKQRLQDIRSSLEYYIKSQRDENEKKEIVLQPLFIATVKSLQCEKRLHDILKYYVQFCLDKDQKKTLSNISGFTEIYFFSEALVKTFEDYVISSGYQYSKSIGLIEEMIRMIR